jgi:hypothetical protein
MLFIRTASRSYVNANALTKSILGIPCIRLDQNQGNGKDVGAKRFRVDPYFQVLLLHGYVDHDLI